MVIGVAHDTVESYNSIVNDNKTEGLGWFTTDLHTSQLLVQSSDLVIEKKHQVVLDKKTGTCSLEKEVKDIYCKNVICIIDAHLGIVVAIAKYTLETFDSIKKDNYWLTPIWFTTDLDTAKLLLNQGGFTKKVHINKNYMF